jgi:FixJ family two-component response regulator
MPLLDGIELIMALSRGGWTMPVIAMTGVPPDAVPYLRIARRLGAVRTLTKPFTISELMKVAKEALAPLSAASPAVPAAANADSPGHRTAPLSPCHRGQVQEQG